MSDLPVSSVRAGRALVTVPGPGAPERAILRSELSGNAPPERVWPKYALVGAVVGAGLVIGHVVVWCQTKSKIGCANDDTLAPYLVLAVPVGALAGGGVGALVGAAVDASRSSRAAATQ